jgi:hypothetical protein
MIRHGLGTLKFGLQPQTIVRAAGPVPNPATALDLTQFTGATAMNLTSYTKLTRLPDLSGLTALQDLYSPPGITALPSLPSHLRLLNLVTSAKLTSLPGLTGLTHLEKLYTPPGITGLSSLPTSLDVLDLSSSKKLITMDIQNLTNFRELNLSGFSALTSVRIPNAISTLTVTGCVKLQSISFG